MKTHVCSECHLPETELKFTDDASSNFFFDFKKYRYGRQVGMQLHGDYFSRGKELLSETNWKEVYVIACEWEYPFSNNVFQVSENVLRKGIEEYLHFGALLEDYRNSKKELTYSEINENYQLIDY